MANVTYLSWNLEKYGPGKYIKNGIGAANYSALLRAVAETAKAVGANIVALLELTSGTALDIGTNIMEQLILTDGGGQPRWTGTTIQTPKQDTYVLLWQKGNGFDGVPDGAKNYVRGLVSQNSAGQPLKFQQGGAKGNSGGRQPGYVLFKTNDRGGNADVYFTVLTYHAMYNSNALVNATGVTSIASAAEVTTAVVFNANNYAVTSSLIGGDFNADLLTNPNAYTALGAVGTGTITAGMGNAAKSTLVDKTPPVAPQSTLDYRKSAYDNIYCRAVQAGPNNGRVLDILSEFGIWQGAGSSLKHVAEMFDASAVTNGNLIASLPPTTAIDAWHIYTEAISNHLPVVATVTI